MLQFSAADLVIGAAAGRGDKHHYIPVFYSQEWVGADGRVCEYSRPYDVVKPRRVHPDGTGYVRGLYTVPRNDSLVSEFVEREFLKVTDNGAARVLRMFKLGKQIEWTSDTRSAWSRFIVSLMIRNPEYVGRVAAEIVGFFDPKSNELNEKYRAIRRPEDPETYAEYIALTGQRDRSSPAESKITSDPTAFQRSADDPAMPADQNRLSLAASRKALGRRCFPTESARSGETSARRWRRRGTRVWRCSADAAGSAPRSI